MFRGQDLAPFFVNHFAMLVDDVVVFHQVLADIKIMAFPFFLRRFDRARHHAVFNRHIIGKSQPVHDAFHAIRAENAHEIVFHGKKKLGRTRIALPPRAAAPRFPAWVMIFASSSCCLAFNIWNGIPSSDRRCDNCSFFSMDTVPISTGWPASWRSFTSCAIAAHLPLAFLNTRSGKSFLIMGLCV